MQPPKPQIGNPLHQLNGHPHEPSPSDQTPTPFPHPLLPPAHIPLPQLCARVYDRVSAFLAQDAATEHLRSAQEQTRISLKVIEDALKKYSLSELSLSYNGGKDCLVLLILYLCALHSHPSITSSPAIQSVYIVSAHPFTEVESFVLSSSTTCSLSLSRYNTGMKSGFTTYLSDNPCVKAIFVGTRRTDPHGANLTHFDPTDHGWPSFMRIHPVIDWHYVDIWTFIRHLNIPYCALYDQGYTSLGGTTDTHRNPALRRNSVSGTGTPRIEFRPAYELVEDEEERLGRDWERRGLAASGKETPLKEKGVGAALGDAVAAAAKVVEKAGGGEERDGAGNGV